MKSDDRREDTAAAEPNAAALAEEKALEERGDAARRDGDLLDALVHYRMAAEVLAAKIAETTAERSRRRSKRKLTELDGIEPGISQVVVEMRSGGGAFPSPVAAYLGNVLSWTHAMREKVSKLWFGTEEERSRAYFGSLWRRPRVWSAYFASLVATIAIAAVPILVLQSTRTSRDAVPQRGQLVRTPSAVGKIAQQSLSGPTLSSLGGNARPIASCRQAVEGRLVSPGTARWKEPGAEHLGGTRYRVLMRVDSQDAGGEPIRSYWSCETDYLGSDHGWSTKTSQITSSSANWTGLASPRERPG